MRKGNFTEEEIKNAKTYMEAGIKSVQDEQDSEIAYYIGQELAGQTTTFEEYTNKVRKVTREDIQKVANSIRINTIYFLRN